MKAHFRFSPLSQLLLSLCLAGALLVANLRTFSEQDFRDTGEWLLAPKRLGLPTIPQTLADAIRARLLSPLRVDFQSPSGVQLVLCGKEAWVYSFRDGNARVQFGHKTFELPAHEMVWLPLGKNGNRIMWAPPTTENNRFSLFHDI